MVLPLLAKFFGRFAGELETNDFVAVTPRLEISLRVCVVPEWTALDVVPDVPPLANIAWIEVVTGSGFHLLLPTNGTDSFESVNDFSLTIFINVLALRGPLPS